MGEIDARIAAAEFWSSVGFWILVTGLVGDIIVLVIPRHRERLEKLLAAIFTIVIIIGVAIEHRADAAKSDLVRQREAATALQVAALEKAAGDARRTAGQADERAAKAEAHLAESNQRAANAERSLLELRQRLADRRISLEQRKKMLAALKAHPPSRVVIQSLVSAGREALQYGKQIAAVFREASWIVTDPDGRGAFTEPISGVFLVISPDMESTDLPDFITNVVIAGELSPAPITTSPETRRGNGVLEIWVAAK